MAKKKTPGDDVPEFPQDDTADRDEFLNDPAHVDVFEDVEIDDEVAEHVDD